MNTRDALYRGPPITSQYSWNDTRYAVGSSARPSHRTLVTVATRIGNSSRIFRSMSGSVWIGRIGMLSASFDLGGGSRSPLPPFPPPRRAPRGAALRDHLLDHLLTEDFELRILPRTCHVPLPDEDEDDAGT